MKIRRLSSGVGEIQREGGMLVPAACEVIALDGGGAEVAVEVGPYDPERHAEGLDLKAVTWHQAAFERTAQGWRARVVFDI